MPEYLAPGVYIEETSFRSKSIEGVSTSTAGFVGPTRFGPITGDPELLTSFADFEHIYGGLDDLVFDGKPQPNYLAHAVRAFFEEGGKRLYVSRVFSPASSTPPPSSLPPGYASTSVSGTDIQLVARFPGEVGNMRLTFILQVGATALSRKADGNPTLTRVQNYDLVHVRVRGNDKTWNAVDETNADGLYQVSWDAKENEWKLSGKSLSDIIKNPAATVQIRPITVTVEIEYPYPNDQGFETPLLLGNFGFAPRSANGLSSTFALVPATRPQYLTTPFALRAPESLSALDIARMLITPDVIKKLYDDTARVTDLQMPYILDGGEDGSLPTEHTYAGDADESTIQDLLVGSNTSQLWKNGLQAFEGIEDISIVAAPGYSALASQDQVLAVHNALINHCEKMRYRIAVLDTPPNKSVSEALVFRNQRSSSYAALYYPWVTVPDPQGPGRLNLPPSGFIAGIYARNDINRSVSKAPANEVIGSAIDFEQRLNKAQQEVLNPAGVNCLRFFAGRGFLVWGARTISDDPEWKYVNLRRYFAYLEHSIDRGTQWVVFENNSQQLWDNVRHTIEDFLLNEWKMGSLMGSKPEEAYFVRCDLSTMTQNDLDNGRLVCLIGVSAVRPAEFVIFRIGQWTANTGNR